jgi:hypothetical protein
MIYQALFKRHKAADRKFGNLELCIFVITFLLVASNGFAAQNKSIRVFQVGASKCGTSSLANLFNASGVRSIHHDAGKLAETMYFNQLNKRPLLSGGYENYTGYFDMESIMTSPPIYGPLLFFKELDKQYPGSKFILNTRDRASLLKSMAAPKINGVPYLDIFARQHKISKVEALKMWNRMLDEHYKNVLEYFKDRPNDLLVFDIDKDPPEKIAIFFKDYFKLNPKMFLHINKTTY